MMRACVAAVIVTYQDRRQLLSEVLHRLAGLSPRPRAVVVVFNGVPYDPAEFVRGLGTAEWVIPIVMGQNEGSAAGFRAGLKTVAERTSADYFWLLDDDNCPEPDALEKLLGAAAQFDCNPAIAFLSLRTARWEYLEAAYNGRRLFIRQNSFHGFHLGETLAKRIGHRRLLRHDPASPPQAPLVQVEYAPYGGLLLHRRLWEKEDGPTAAYYVYGDDHEYTVRLIRAGARIYLCAASKLRDLERSWFMGSSRCHYLLDPASPPERVFLTLRNRIALERSYFVSSTPLYFLNMAGFLVLILLRSMPYILPGPHMARRIRLLARAVRDAHAGRLGRPVLRAGLEA